MSQVRVGVIGLGVGREHAAGFVRIPGCRVQVLCDLSAATLQEVGGQFPGARLTRDAGEVLAAADVDLVSIATYDDTHAPLVVGALERGKHVFVEKPLCCNPAELAQIRRAWEGAGGRLQLAANLVLRSAPLYLWLRERVRAGDFGRLYAFDGEYLYGRLHKITEGWRGQVEGYSVMAGGGIHLLDLFLWLTGERPGRVCAAGNHIATEGTGFRYDDFAAATFECPSGVVARIAANFGCVHPHQHVVRVFGTEATFVYDDAGARWHRSRDPQAGAQPLDLSPRPETKGQLLPCFVAAVRGGRDLGAETRACFDTLSAVFASDAARQTRTWKDIVYL